MDRRHPDRGGDGGGGPGALVVHDAGGGPRPGRAPRAGGQPQIAPLAEGCTAGDNRRVTLGTRRLARLLLVVAAVVGIAPGTTHAMTAVARADDAADARKHAQRASSLAASGKCRQAV